MEPPRRAILPSDVFLFALIGVMLCIEFTLLAADMRIFGASSWRSTMYAYGAFWAGLLDNWRPNFELQPVTMFLSYAFLHSGSAHVIGNMLILFLLNRILRPRIGSARFFTVYFLSAIGGAVGYVLLAKSAHPMVGASGALFGLMGAWQWTRRRVLRAAGRSLAPVHQTALFLVAANIVMLVLLDGQLAWQTHLGGYVTGWMVLFLGHRIGRFSKPT